MAIIIITKFSWSNVCFIILGWLKIWMSISWDDIEILEFGYFGCNEAEDRDLANELNMLNFSYVEGYE